MANDVIVKEGRMYRAKCMLKDQGIESIWLRDPHTRTHKLDISKMSAEEAFLAKAIVIGDE